MHDPVKTSSLHAFFEANALLGAADVVLQVAFLLIFLDTGPQLLIASTYQKMLYK